MKRILCACLLFAMLLTVAFSGCGKTEGQNAGTGTKETSGTEKTADGKAEYFKKYDPVITLTENMTQSSASDMKWYPGENIESNRYTKWVEDTCGVKFTAKWIVADGETDKQKLNIAAASNDLPDIIQGYTPEIAKFIKAGLLMPLDDLIEQYASPLTKYILDTSDKASKGNLKLPFTVGGKLYAFPMPFDNPGFWSVGWIRKDILDQLGKPIPETLEQLEDILAAYKAKYPNGYGIPLDKELNLNLVMPAFNASVGRWYEDDSGKIVYGSIQPQVKEGLAVLRDWYQKGYIDKEFVAKTGEKVMEDFTRGDMLSWGPGAWWNVWWPFPDLWANVPEAEMSHIPVLKGSQGQQLLVVDTTQGLGVAINKNAKNPEAVMYVFNESVDSFYRGYDFVIEDMKKVGYDFKYPYTERQTAKNAEDPERIMDEFSYEVEGYGYFNKGRTHPNTTFGFKGDLPQLYELILSEVADIGKTGKLEGHSIEGQNEYNAISSDPKRMKSFIPMFDYWVEFQNSDSIRPNMLVCSPTDTQIEKSSFLSTMEKEAFARIIMGSLPLDAFDKFVQDWNSNGGEQWLKEVNDWYQSTK